MINQNVVHDGTIGDGLKENNENFLLRSLQRGEKKAFELIFNNYYLLLLAFTKEYLPDTDTAKDIVQETMITLWERKELLNPGSNLRAYLFTIARNKSLNYLKRKQLENKIVTESATRLAETYLNYYALKDQSAFRICNLEFEKLVAEGIESLPDQCRTIFNLSRLEYLKNQEIADQLNVSIKTVEYHMTKSLKILRKKLACYLQQVIYF